MDAFGKLLKAAGEVAGQHAEMPAAEVTAMYIALAEFTASVYPDRLDFVDLVLTSCYQASASPASVSPCLSAVF